MTSINGSILALLTGCGLAALSPAPAAAADTSFSAAPSNSPVHWLPLGEAALARARQENKPVYVLTGSQLSELSRSTVESLANAETAAYFNAHFICVLVDREVRPDFAAAAQQYLRTVKQLSGWPVNLWLTPGLQPYDGASYLPQTEEWGKKSLLEIATAAAEAWRSNPAACRRAAAEASRSLAAEESAAPAFDAAKLAAAVDAGARGWRAQFDAAHGGFGDPPRYPQPELLRFLLRQGPADRALALASLRALAGSALRDPLDGGFFRYLQDAEGRFPYPQKTLADQARLALAYLDAQQASPDPVFADAARGALDYALLRLGRADGTCASAEDGTHAGAETYFAWTAAEIAAALGTADAARFDSAYAVLPDGNISSDTDPSGQFSGKNLLRRATPLGNAAAEKRLARMRARLLARRDRRPGLVRDDRAAADAHGLLLAALARAGEVLGDARYLAAARRLGETASARFVTADGDVRHFAAEDGVASPIDYTALALGFRTLARATRDAADAALADQLLARCDQRFLEPGPGIYAASSAQPSPAVFLRAPALVLADNSPTPESLALLAQARPATAETLRSGFALRLAAGETATGDALLALGGGSLGPPGPAVKE